MDIIGEIGVISYYLVIGCVIGFMSSSVGLGGSIIAILVLIFDMGKIQVDFSEFEKTRVVIGNTMMVLLATNIAITIKERSTLKIPRDMLFSILVPGIVASALATWLIISYDLVSIYFFTVLFFIMMLYTSFVIFTSRKVGFGVTSSLGGTMERIKMMGAGAVSGVISGMTACEPSPVIVPSLNKKLDLAIDKSVYIYSTIFYYITLLISLMYLLSPPDGVFPFEGSTIGYIVLPKALPMALGSFLTSYLGYELFKKTGTKYMAYIVTFILLLFSIRIFFWDIIKPLY